MSDHFDYKKTVRTYLTVFGILMIGTIITVAISYLHLPLGYAILIALIVATIKASFVACYFMHLISEKKMIYLVLSFTAVCFMTLIFLPQWEHFSVPDGTTHHPFTTIEEKVTEHVEHVS